MNTNKVVALLEKDIVAVKETDDDKQCKDTPESNRFKKLSDGWILDKALNVEWGPSSNETMTFEKANKYARSQGGRLPTVKELRSLIDYDKCNPAIDTQFFSDTKTNDWYWTGTTYAGSSSVAWVVIFSNGNVFWGTKDYNFYVRPVRPSQNLII